MSARRPDGRASGRPGPGRSVGLSVCPTVRLSVFLLATACASAGDPPGGPPDLEPPEIVSISPDSGAILDIPPDEVSIVFSEVINERITGQRTEIGGAVLLSPALGDVRVSWRRNRLVVRPREGFQPGRIYRIDILPVLTDLRQNRIRSGRSVVFSTGPAIPAGAINGAVVDWPGGRPAPLALIEAVLLPESLPYRFVADSLGLFRAEQMPLGEYLVYGVLDTDHNRRRGTREAHDTVRIQLDSSATVELYAFPRDTLPPRLRQVEIVDSLTLRLNFDRALSTTVPLDTALITVALEEDSTSRLAIAGVYTARELERLRFLADSLREVDRLLADSAEGRPAPAPAARQPVPAPAAPQQRGLQRAGGGPPVQQRDSTLAMRMIGRRPPPTDSRLVRLVAPLEPERRYLIIVESVTSLNGVAGRARAQLRVPRAPARPAPRDSAAADSTARDSVPAAAGRPGG